MVGRYESKSYRVGAALVNVQIHGGFERVIFTRVNQLMILGTYIFPITYARA
jgi:hypothetical protein